MKHIKNIIFDLGGVLLHLDMGKSEAAFCSLKNSKEAYEEMVNRLMTSGLFKGLEVGVITGNAFVRALQREYSDAVTKEEIYNAWGAMLLDFPERGLHLLEELKAAGYRIFLLSNTNEIHLASIREQMERVHGIKDFDGLFEKAYYSHLVELRKPNVEIYEHVIQDAEIDAEVSLFIDDNAENLEGAKAAGLNTLLHPANGNLYEQLKALLDF